MHDHALDMAAVGLWVSCALEGAWQDACASMPKELDKVDDCGTCKDVVLSTSQLPTLLRHLDVAALKAQVEARSE
ncbi:hypothetical protein AK812_SmicGene10550 [Symbiodinium microadriaticum]|uniref:Uncharacterized protein n=1 Tax=Symbiodinium microadriaticum TaxID=2951 RepID=A0A1Q9EFQ0_SYMMI|nr:hypothetical protein AK812_SmicGene10550 [Symbiodinium microadriaticum]